MKRFKLLRVTCDLSAILDFAEEMRKEKQFSRQILKASDHTQDIKFELFYQILIIAKMSKTEMYVSFYYQNRTKKTMSIRPGYGLSLEPNMKQIHEAVQALESDMILAACLDFVGKTKKRKNTRNTPWGQNAYWKYFEIIRARLYSYNITKFWW